MERFVRVRGVALALVLSAATVGAALAHSGLQRAEPPASSTLKRPPAEVKLSFTERLEAAYCSVQVTDAAGHQVDRQDVRLDPGSGRQLRVTLQPLDPGTYAVVWRVLSVDSHVTEGRFSFRIE